MHGPSTLLYVHELLAFLSHHACWNVVGAESAAELGPRHLVLCGVSGGVVGLDYPKPVIGLERLSYLSEERRVSGRKVTVGCQSWSGSIPCPMAAAGRVGQQLS
jgi:hypothetical protein